MGPITADRSQTRGAHPRGEPANGREPDYQYEEREDRHGPVQIPLMIERSAGCIVLFFGTPECIQSSL